MEYDQNHANSGVKIPAASLVRCIDKALTHHAVDTMLLTAIIKTENGNQGSFVINSNGTADLGPAQINTIHLDEPWFKFQYPEANAHEVANNVCLNIDIAANILHQRISELRPDQSIWDAAGHYHSKTKKVKIIYLQRLMKNYQLIAEKKGSCFNIN